MLFKFPFSYFISLLFFNSYLKFIGSLVFERKNKNDREWITNQYVLVFCLMVLHESAPFFPYISIFLNNPFFLKFSAVND